MFSHFGTIPACDRQTDRRTDIFLPRHSPRRLRAYAEHRVVKCLVKASGLWSCGNKSVSITINLTLPQTTKLILTLALQFLYATRCYNYTKIHDRVTGVRLLVGCRFLLLPVCTKLAEVRADGAVLSLLLLLYRLETAKNTRCSQPTKSTKQRLCIAAEMLRQNYWSRCAAWQFCASTS